MQIFEEIKRIISQFFETEYWYRFRKYQLSSIDNDKIETYKNSSGFSLACTWDGENDILSTMLLKVEHQFYNLKKYGNHLYSYFNSSDILKYGNEEDKVWIFNKIVNTKKVDRIINDELQYDFYIKDALIVKKLNLKNETWYIEINKIRKEINPYDYAEEIIQSQHSVEVDVSEYKNISKELLKYISGQRQTLVELLELRHNIKKLLVLDFCNDKYYKLWKCDRTKEATELYLEDRKKYYKNIFELMFKKGDTWWD